MLLRSSLLVLLLVALPLFGAEPATFQEHVKPFLAKYCVECHNPRKASGDLDLSTYRALQEGGKNGPSAVPGKPDESLLVTLTERKRTPQMPPRSSRQPTAAEAAVLRAWVAAGAREDGSVDGGLSPVKPRVPVQPSITALAYTPKGAVLAVGTYGMVQMLDAADGEILGKLHGQQGKVTALAFRPDGETLAVASGEPGDLARVRLYFVPPSGVAGGRPDYVLDAHDDAVYALTFRPDGKLLATAGYDHLIKLWNPDDGKAVATLKDHSDAVYGLAFSPDGKLLASAAADRAVKVWDVATGKRLYTLGESTDWLYAVAWSPDGKFLAAAGVDRSIRVWQVDADGGKIVHSAFAHEKPITRLIYGKDGRTLYSLAEDGSLKAWDTGKLTERRLYPKQDDTVLSLVLRPDGKQLALGRFDGALVLLDEATGKELARPLPVKPKPPQLEKVAPAIGPSGRALRLRFEGKALRGVTEVVSSVPGTQVQLLEPGPADTERQADVTFPASAAPGAATLAMKGPGGTTKTLPFTLDRFPAIAETEPNNAPVGGQAVTLPVTVAGSLDRAGDVDFLRFPVQAGQELGVQVSVADPAQLAPVLELTDATGRTLATSEGGYLGHRFETAGTVTLGLHDRDFRGGAKSGYRLHVGDVPVVTGFFPRGVTRGTATNVEIDGVHLGPTRKVRVQVPADAAVGSKLPVPLQTPWGAPLGAPQVVVGEFPGVVESEKGETLPVPGTGDGRLSVPGEADEWSFAARKGRPLIVEVESSRLGVASDAVLEILDADGKPVPRATLRCQAKTFVTFRDHDNAQPNIRIDAWTELAINDPIFVGGELVKIKALPTHPDADCFFFSEKGRRTGYLGTTPAHLAMGEPMYKVSIHPPGTTFPPNGMPVITLPFRNDDGGPDTGKDPRLTFDPPADGTYRVRVTDTRGQGGPWLAYRLTVRPPRPDFRVRLSPAAPAVWKGGAVPVNLEADRLDGFDGPIHIRLADLPPGFHAPETTIAPGEFTTSIALSADATTPKPTKPLRVTARATIDDREVLHEEQAKVPTLREGGDLMAKTAPSTVTLRPGGTAYLTVTIERRNDFKGRVPVEVRGLPHGVRVTDIGLNGILITEAETSRRMKLYAEPWVPATEQPIVVLAKREGKNTEHAAGSVLLRIPPPNPTPTTVSEK